MALATYNHQDPDFALDPLSMNRRLQPNADLAALGTVVVDGHTRETIQVLVPDCTVPPVGNDVRIDLRHVVELKIGTAFDMGHRTSPSLYVLIPWSRLWAYSAYWEEINPLLTE